MKPTLDIASLAAELGRSEDWARHNWRWLVVQQQMPPPISGADIARTGSGGALIWSSAQIYAWLDRSLPPPQRAAAAAFRAAAHAYVAGQDSEAAAIAADRAALDQRLIRQGAQT